MIDDYINLIQQFLDKGYDDIFFNELSSPNNQLIIRHDIDFDCEIAHKMAEAEYLLGVKSSYFFMLTNPIYNIFSKKNKELIQNIKNFGHYISVHFDFKVGDLKKEIEIFDSFFNVETNIISVHRPNLQLLHNINFEHTYLPKYFNKIKYFSDSRGEFRYGNPIESSQFKEGKSIQLLIHPEWWASGKSNPIEVLQSLIDKNNKMNIEFFTDNCIPFKEYLK